ncbi:MAG: hypothetical protein WD294_13595 [Phycisphaeraceae bacterium]
MAFFKRIRKGSRSRREHYQSSHRFEHWYADNQVYFITARCRDRVPAFASEQAKVIFWDRFRYYTHKYGFIPWVTSLLDNHYHTLGYIYNGENLPQLMRHLHGSVAKLVNDTYPLGPPASVGGEPRPSRLVPFWRDTKGREYFDGCIRDEKQCWLAYRYTLTQARRHGVSDAPATYPHTQAPIDVDHGVRRATEVGAFLEALPYKRYRS